MTSTLSSLYCDNDTMFASQVMWTTAAFATESETSTERWRPNLLPLELNVKSQLEKKNPSPIIWCIIVEKCIILDTEPCKCGEIVIVSK